MKVKIFVILVVLAVLASSITACTTKGSYLIQVMKLAPENTEAVYCTDIKATAEDPDLSFAYDEMISAMSYDVAFVVTSDISVYAKFEIDWESTIVLFGDFNLEDVRDALTDEDFVESEYRGIEIWTYNYTDDSVAFIGSMIIFSDDTDQVKACIRRYKNEESSMYDDEDMKVVADRLPSGISYMVFGPDVTRIEVLSGSICWINTTNNDDILDITGWLKFDSAASAEAAMENVEDDLSRELDITITDVRLSGQFIEFTGEMEISE
jgi:predicted small lipoprotein YifL